MKPGPQFGEVLEAVETRQLEGAFRDREEALAWVKEEYASTREASEENVERRTPNFELRTEDSGRDPS